MLYWDVEFTSKQLAWYFLNKHVNQDLKSSLLWGILIAWNFSSFGPDIDLRTSEKKKKVYIVCLSACLLFSNRMDFFVCVLSKVNILIESVSTPPQKSSLQVCIDVFATERSPTDTVMGDVWTRFAVLPMGFVGSLPQKKGHTLNFSEKLEQEPFFFLTCSNRWLVETAIVLKCFDWRDVCVCFLLLLLLIPVTTVCS